jgi:hypothetical protein
MNKESLTKVFLRSSGQAVNEVTIKQNLPVWWQNTRINGGLRLTDDGILFITEELQIQTYDVPFPKDFKITSQVIIFLDRFINCPYWVGRHGIVVTDEKKAVELHLFSGDIRKYGLTKAMNRQSKEQ